MSAPVNIILNVLGASSVMSALDGVRNSLAGLAAVGISATAAVGAVGRTLDTGVQFNAQLEQARLGVAAVLKQFDDAGKFKNFEEAVAASAAAIELLKQKAVSSPASFSSLVQAYQATVGPMTAANIAMRDQVNLIVNMSQALAGLGIHESQILQETRALITGNINADAAAAKILGITAADISKARAKGELYQFLASKIAAFAEAGERGAQSLNTLKSNLGDAFEQRSADATLALNDALKGFYGQLTQLVNSPEFQQFVAVFANQAAGIVGGITATAQALEHVPFSALANAGIAAGTILAGGVAVKLAQKLDFAVLDWATRAGSPVGQTFASRFLVPLTAGLNHLFRVLLPAWIGFEVGRALGNALRNWREAPVVAARAGDAPVTGAIEQAGAIDSDEARQAALAKLVTLQREITAARDEEAGKIVSSNEALQIYGQQLAVIRGMVGALNSDWAQQRIALNQAAANADRLAKTEKDAATWLLSDAATKARETIADAVADRTDPAERLASARAWLAIQERNLAIARAERAAGRDTAVNQQLLLRSTVARELVLRDIAALEEKIARTTAEQAQLDLNTRLRRISQRRAELDGEFSRTDAEKWAERRRLIDDEIAAQQRYLDILQQRLAATNDPAARATLMGDIGSGLDRLAGAYGESASLGPDPNSYFAQMQAGITALRESWGTAAQNMAQTMTGAMDAARGATGDFLYNILSGAQNMRQAWNGAMLSIGQSFLRMTTDMIAKMIWRSTVERALTALGVTAHLTGEAAKTAGTTAGSGIRLGLIIKEALADVYHGAIAAFKALSGIPYVGPFLGAAAMAAALAGGIALISKIGGHEQGGLVAGGRQLSWLNEGGQEFVWSAPAVRAMGADNLAAMHNAAKSGNLGGLAAAAAPSSGGSAAAGASAGGWPRNIALIDGRDRSAIDDLERDPRGEAYIVRVMDKHRARLGRRT